MRRLLAGLLVPALILSTALGSSLHVHEYFGHDHPEHRHGPATHEHPLIAEPGHHPHHDNDKDHAGAEVAPADDPGRHAVSITAGVTCAQRFHIDIAFVEWPQLLDPGAEIRSSLPPTDVRAHGPPSTADSPPRAPPLPQLA